MSRRIDKGGILASLKEQSSTPVCFYDLDQWVHDLFHVCSSDIPILYRVQILSQHVTVALIFLFWAHALDNSPTGPWRSIGPLPEAWRVNFKRPHYPILQWLEEQHLTNEGSFKDLSAAIGAHPAIRRSYRKWVAELVERDPDAADRLFEAAISETEISAQFCDDTLISLLKAPSSPEFLTRHEAQLLANDKAILKRVIQAVLRGEDDFREIIFSGVGGMPAARDLPELVVSVATDFLLASEDDLRRDHYSPSSLDLETHFGIKEGLRSDFSPASAHRGPWIPLLRHHRRQALDFLINIFNHSADWYAHPRVHDPLEPAWEIELTFADRTTRKQWGNQRLWNMYRGTSVSPHVLESLLMAFEKWLFEFGRKYPRRCCTARSKSLTSLCRLQSHPAQYVSGIPSAAILLSISHPIRCSTRCLANVRARISGPIIAL